MLRSWRHPAAPPISFWENRNGDSLDRPSLPLFTEYPHASTFPPWKPVLVHLPELLSWLTASLPPFPSLFSFPSHVQACHPTGSCCLSSRFGPFPQTPADYAIPWFPVPETEPRRRPPRGWKFKYEMATVVVMPPCHVTSCHVMSRHAFTCPVGPVAHHNGQGQVQPQRTEGLKP